MTLNPMLINILPEVRERIPPSRGDDLGGREIWGLMRQSVIRLYYPINM